MNLSDIDPTKLDTQNVTLQSTLGYMHSAVMAYESIRYMDSYALLDTSAEPFKRTIKTKLLESGRQLAIQAMLESLEGAKKWLDALYMERFALKEAIKS